MSSNIIYLDIEGYKIPVKIITERRHNVRASLASQHVILRVPHSGIFKTDLGVKVKWVEDWLVRLKKTKPGILEKYRHQREYVNGNILHIGEQQFILEILKVQSNSGAIKLKDPNILSIKIPDHDQYNHQKLIRQLLIKFSQRYFLSFITAKVHFYNDRYFQKEINSIRLKYNKSNWGSCSAGKNLNFSVRLLFAPSPVIDYVIVHELAHLIEMNHSDRFWKIVHNIIPDYQEKEKILKESNGIFDF